MTRMTGGLRLGPSSLVSRWTILDFVANLETRHLEHFFNTNFEPRSNQSDKALHIQPAKPNRQSDSTRCAPTFFPRLTKMMMPWLHRSSGITRPLPTTLLPKLTAQEQWVDEMIVPTGVDAVLCKNLHRGLLPVPHASCEL